MPALPIDVPVLIAKDNQGLEMGIFSQPLRPAPLRREYGDGRAERREHGFALVPVARDLLEDVQHAADRRAERRRDSCGTAYSSV